VTSLGNRKVLVVGDMFTRFAVAVEMRTKEQIKWWGYTRVVDLGVRTAGAAFVGQGP
jgi:hypothetical protein